MYIHSIGIPPPPKNINVTDIDILSTTDTELSVNLTWSLDNQCVVVYHVEVTNTNTSNITNMNSTSQYIVLTLQTGVVYSFRVRGADSAGRGEWSRRIYYASPELITSSLPTVAPTNIGNYDTSTPHVYI